MNARSMSGARTSAAPARPAPGKTILAIPGMGAFGPAAPAIRDAVPKLVRWSFVLFWATLPFEAADLGFASSMFSLAKLAGFLFIAAYLFYYNPIPGKRRYPPVPAPLWCFLAYLAVYVAHGFFLDPVYLGGFVSLFFTLAQLLVLFWIASSLLENESVARAALIAYGLAAVASALGTLLEVPGFSTVITSRTGTRVTSLEFNPNYLAYTYALAGVILSGLALSAPGRWSAGKLFLMGLIVPLLAMIVRTGSRAGFGAFAIGFAVYVLLSRQSQRRAVVLGISVVIGAALAYLVLQNQTMLTRLEQAYAGNLSARDMILSASLEMIGERPLLGWQPVALWSELARRVGQIWGAKDAHNLIVHLLLEVGIVGAVPFFFGLWLCVRSAWRGRSGGFEALPLALLLAALSANLTHTFITRKPQWLVLALAVAAGSTVKKSEMADRLRGRTVFRSEKQHRLCRLASSVSA